jgi:FemAB-related protein (PEP-CTERM system-associated)
MASWRERAARAGNRRVSAPLPQRPPFDRSSGITVELATDPQVWNGFVAAHPAGSITHRWEWGAVIAETYGHRTHRFVARGASGIEGVLALTEVRSRLFGVQLCSMPYVDDGGVLASTPIAWSGLLEAAAALAARLRIRSIELRQRHPRADLPTRGDRVTLILDLPNGDGHRTGAERIEALWKGFSTKMRNHVRKAEKSGLVAERHGADAIRAFYGVWRVNMRDLGSPAHSERWFEQVAAHFAAETSVYLVRRGSEVMGGLIALEHGGGIVVPWASSDRRYFSLCPNNLLFWTAIQAAAERGLQRFDFGRSAVGSGTFVFKRQWGAEPVQLYWQDLDPVAGRIALLPPGQLPALAPEADHDRRRELGEKLWQRLPVPIATWLGARLRGGITL